jgi:PLP dependent protein
VSGVAGRLADVKARLAAAATRSGRSPGEVKLVAVSKTKPPQAVREAYAAGQRAFGESYAQELAEKALALGDLTDIEWHFIGHLQSNKAKLIVRAARMVHTVDSEGLVRELGRRVTQAGKAPLSVLIEVNVAGEAQKFGVSAGDLAELIAAVSQEPALVLRGLMTVPPLGDVTVARSIFSTLASLRALHGGPSVLPELSMGMTGDMEDAVGCGATIVRVGTAIFGPRN